MNIKDEIRRLISDMVMHSGHEKLFREPLVGFASADDPLFLELKKIVDEKHLLPFDLLPDAKTVVSFFIPFTEAVVDSNRENADTSREWAEAYVSGNKLINDIALMLKEELKKKDIKCESVKATHNYDTETLKSAWSHRSAAFIAGLGRFGLNRMLITSVGGAGRYGSVVISEEISPDARPSNEPCSYFDNKGCKYCVVSCPTNALTLDGFDKHKCHDFLIENSKMFTDIGLCDVCGKCVVGPCAWRGENV